MRFTISTVLLLASVLTLTLASPLGTSPSSELLQPRNACSQGINICCGSASMSCSGNVCKACCGNKCGCFYSKGSSCSSNFPCTDVNKPDFAPTNGQCVAPRGGGLGGSGGSTGGGSTGSSGSSGSGSSSSRPSYCSELPHAFARFFGC